MRDTLQGLKRWLSIAKYDAMLAAIATYVCSLSLLLVLIGYTWVTEPSELEAICQPIGILAVVGGCAATLSSLHPFQLNARLMKWGGVAMVGVGVYTILNY